MKKTFLLLIALTVSILSWGQYSEPTFKVTGDINGNSSLKQTIEQNVTSFLAECERAVLNGTKPKFGKQMTKEAINSFAIIWENSPIVCVDENISERVLGLSDGNYQIRNIHVTMLAEDDPEEAQQDLVITLNKQGVIDNVLFALKEYQYSKIIEEHETVVDLFRRQIIVNFVENYRTAYNKKNLDFIRSVFSDKALIITGKVIKEKPKQSIDLTKSTLTTEKIVYQKSSKTEYINNLKRVFSNNKMIHLDFEDIEVLQHPKYNDIYGVTLKQYWKSDRYSDIGYLFLMIDFHDEMNPEIQVRTWQPDKLNNIELNREKDVFSMGDFQIAR